MNWKAFGLTGLIVLLIVVFSYGMFMLPLETGYLISKIGAVGIVVASVFGVIYCLYKLIDRSLTKE